MAVTACKAMYFDGADDYVGFVDNAAYDVTTAMSFSLWMWRHAVPAQSPAIFIYRNGTVTIGIDMADHIYVTVGGAGGGTYTFTKYGVPKQTRVHLGIVGVESGASMVFKLYVDGVLVEFGVIAACAWPVGNANAFALGSTGAASWFKGSMTNLYAATDEITAAEMATLFADGWAASDPTRIDNDFFVLAFSDGTGTAVTNLSDDATVPDGVVNGSAAWWSNPGLTLQDNPMEVATVGQMYAGLVAPRWVEWIGPTTAGHTWKLVSNLGKTIVEGKCAVANEGGGQKVVDFLYEGLTALVLDSGKVLVYFE